MDGVPNISAIHKLSVETFHLQLKTLACWCYMKKLIGHQSGAHECLYIRSGPKW